MVFDVSWKIMKKDNGYDLINLQLKQLSKNLESIRKEKNNMWKSFLLFQNYFPTIGDVTWNKNKIVTQQINYFVNQ